MIIFFFKSQGVLFDTPVLVHGSVHKDGKVVRPHYRVQKKRAPEHHGQEQPSLFDAPAKEKQHKRLDAYIAKQGGIGAVAAMLQGLDSDQHHIILEKMAWLDGVSIEDIERLLDGVEPDTGDQSDLFAQTGEAEQPEADQPEIVEHTTKRGKVLRGVVRSDLSKDEAQAIDQYTFKKDGGWFIREKHLDAATPAPAAEAEPTPEPAPAPPPREVDSSAPFGVKAGISRPERRRLNAAAAALVADKVPGDMTDADLALLRQYSGNGGCGDSLNEFYTDPGVAASMWSVAASLGITSGTALEPSCGTGVFLHTAPAGFKVTGVELDPTSASIASVLHGDRHEIQTASLERFATQDMRQFDVVIGNPPYGPRGTLARDDKKDLSKAEEYFIDTSLDKTRAGGLCMLVVPAGIMDSKNGRKFRERMLRKAEFLGAQRMPNSAFEASHTDVTADVIYLRKRPDDVASALGAVDKKVLQKLGVWDAEFLSGGYFEGRGKDNLFGSVGSAMRAFGEIYTVNGSMQGVPEEIAGFHPHPLTTAPMVPDILEALPDQAAKDKVLNAAEKRPYQDNARVGDTRVIDGVTYVLQGKPPRWHRVDEVMQTSAVTSAQELAGEIDNLMNGRTADRPKLEEDIKAWIAEHGVPANNPHLLVAAAADKSLYRLIGAVDKDGRLSDAVAGRTARRVEGGFDAVALSLALGRDTGDFTVSDLANALEKDDDDVLEQLTADSRYAWVSGDLWAPMDTYLTGELWPKLDEVKKHLADEELDSALREKMQDQQRRLEQAIDPKSLEDVEIQLNSAFVPLDVIEAWINSKIDALRAEHPSSRYYQDMPAAKVTFDAGVYRIVSGGINESLLDKYLNRTGVRKDDLPTIESYNEEFKEWLCQSQYRDFVEDLYNRKFRGFVQREFSTEPIDIPGLANHDKIKPYAWSGVRWLLAAGKGICAADVGLGKTIRGLLLARLAKMTGKAQKPIIVVPKSVLANWYAESQKWFPGSKVLTIGGTFAYNAEGDLVGRDDPKNERDRKYHDLTQNDYDFIIISEPAFKEIDLDPITKKDMYEKDFWVQRGDSLGNAGDKRIKKVREAYKQAVANREFSEHTDAIHFSDLNVDMLIADEMHHQKNLYAAKSRFGDSPKFLGGQGLSNTALDFNLKARWLLERNGDKGVYGLTATPTKNSPLEIYSMLSHIAPEAFEKIGIRNSEEFLDRFCRFETDNVLGTSGQIETALVTAGFKNLDELREIMFRYIDRTTAEMVGLQLPARDDRMHMVDMTAEQNAVYAELRELADKPKEKDASGDAHIFSIMDKMNKAALDLEILDPELHAGKPSPKYKALAKEVVTSMKDGGQVVFSDYIDSHDKIVAHLVKAGIPRNQIGIINAQVAGSSIKRQNIADKFNAGTLKVVIGNTATMGEGINLQMGTSDIHHMDLPWEPASMQQRNGRGLRQGNVSESVRIHTYLSKGSFDGYRYQTISAKKDWQDLLWNGGNEVDNLSREGQFSREDLMIMLSADPEKAREKFESDKAAAMQRHEAGERSRLAGEFIRFQTLDASYKALKNKGSMSGVRLRKKLDTAQTALKANKYFTAKHVLGSGTDALLHPNTGTVFHAGTAFSTKDGKYVVTGVDLKSNTVKMREYASLHGRTLSKKVADLGHDVTPFTFNEAEESKQVAAKLESAAADEANNITSFDQVRKLPPNILASSHDAIQRQLKEGVKSYKISAGYGRVPMVNNETGDLELIDHYSVSDKVDTHDFLLPTEANKKRMEDAWMQAERNVKFGTRHITASRRGGRTSTKADRYYDGARFDDSHNNPWARPITEANSESGYYGGMDSASIKALKARLHTEQIERAKRADTLSEAIGHVAPLGIITSADSGYSAQFKLPRKALAILWAKARHAGVLNDGIEEHLPKSENGMYAKHNGYFHANHKGSVHTALMAMARASGHSDLAEAMDKSRERERAKEVAA